MGDLWTHVVTAIVGAGPGLVLWLKERAKAEALTAEKAATEAHTIQVAMHSMTKSVDKLTAQIEMQGKQIDAAQRQEEKCMGLLKGMHDEWKDLRKLLKL